jgi:hypothetical protein
MGYNCTMWTCTKCGRIFEREGQLHSCKLVSIEQHFANKRKAKELFDYLAALINEKIGKSNIISLPCCVHLFGSYDFLAALPKKDKLEVRFALDRKLTKASICVPLSAKLYKNCIDIHAKEEFDTEFIGWLKESYHLKDTEK